MFWLRNKENDFQLHTHIWGPVGLNLHAFLSSADLFIFRNYPFSKSLSGILTEYQGRARHFIGPRLD